MSCCRNMSQTMPLFPLGTVLYPGLVLPLHIFEERYRQLVRDLLEGPEPQEFGVIAIRKGRETGVDGVSALYEIGCAAALRQVARHDDGRFDVVTVGTQRFRLLGLDHSRSYLQGEIELLAEETGDEAAAALAVPALQRSFRDYLDALATQGAARIDVPDLPDEPVLLSYLVAASLIVDLSDRQVMLAEPDAASRLAAERALLARRPGSCALSPRRQPPTCGARPTTRTRCVLSLPPRQRDVVRQPFGHRRGQPGQRVRRQRARRGAARADLGGQPARQQDGRPATVEQPRLVADSGQGLPTAPGQGSEAAEESIGDRDDDRDAFSPVHHAGGPGHVTGAADGPADRGGDLVRAQQDTPRRRGRSPVMLGPPAARRRRARPGIGGGRRRGLIKGRPGLTGRRGGLTGCGCCGLTGGRCGLTGCGR